ncbi:hypothetical protein AKJ50_01580 [candidate division MSBL1 archaeon SCGC-AAA382A13]|uniref:Dihydroorotase n=1 Tax=candidate division MSBL1 archaeon SCGC-AAA382A13 TaxID=1698279 RepID=A0A133VFG3_9EURY|nr:hypothetical protein AKJ50_01580 [candidate division MSBL1 archaeon SCGC-AAA382A13]
MVDLCLKNAKIPTQNSIVKGGVAIENGKIASISKDALLPEADKTIDLERRLLLPGIIDTHVHFREPGFTEKEDFSTGSKAAAAGGVTTICDMPNNSPPTDTLERFREKKKLGQKKSYIDFGLHAMMTGSIEEGKKLIKQGAASLKLYPEICDDSVTSQLQDGNALLTVHPEDPAMFKEVDNGDFEDFLYSRPSKAEVSEILRILNQVSDLHVHFCHVTTRKGLDHIMEGKINRNLTCEVTPHHLLLDKSHLEKYGSIAKTHPPLRSERDRRNLLRALEKGMIDIVATDHAPHTSQEKDQNITEAPPGIVGVETSLPLMFTLVKEKKLSLYRMIEAMSLYPGRIFNLRNEENIQKGTLIPGADADIVVLDQSQEWEIKGEELHGKTKFTPFEGKKVVGKPFLTLVRGEIVFKEGEIIGKKEHGKFVSRKTQT